MFINYVGPSGVPGIPRREGGGGGGEARERSDQARATEASEGGGGGGGGTGMWNTPYHGSELFYFDVYDRTISCIALVYFVDLKSLHNPEKSVLLKEWI